MNKALKDNVAYIIKEISTITGKSPGKKSLQKMIYLIEANGIDLKCEYGIHFYGPYSAAVDEATMLLAANNVIRFDYIGYSHKMTVNSEYDVMSDLSDNQKHEIERVIENYKDKKPSELELLTTTHYVHENINDKSEFRIVEGVKKIKGEKYSELQIKSAIAELNIK